MSHPTLVLHNIIWGLTLPIAGWLADVYLGRYKVSIWIMWIASVLLVASSVLSQLVESYYSINNYITIVLFLIMSVGFGGYQANIILFGIDQLQDASTDEITSFISWYLCSYFSGGIIISFVVFCLGGAYDGLLDEFLICISLTVVIISTFAFDNVFLKEPITHNPFQLIYKVINEHTNATIQCIFTEESGTLSSSFDIKWMILPQLLNSVSIVTFSIGVFEFICSQTPYSMRGLLLGTMYGSVVLYCVLGYGIMQPFMKQSTTWGTGIISCEFWYLLVILLILLLGSVVMLLLIMSVGFGGYQANIVLFGIDQLQDASTDEITSFISWYLCSYFSGGIIIFFVVFCLGGAYGGLLEEFLICICLTIVVILILAFDNIFLKEPITHNPFQLIYKVIKYAIKNKHPRCRSAFTYCKDELPSRIDLGKSKHGGPFTTEEVENVRTFLRLVIVIIVGSTVGSAASQLLGNNDKVDSLHFEGFYKCRWRPPVNIAYISGAVLVPVYEFFFYPLLQKRISCIQSYHWKVSVGAIAQIARIITLMAIDLTTRHSYLKHKNATIRCIFAKENRTLLSSILDNYWMVLPHVLHMVSVTTFAIGAFEFICSQSPYSMRGLLFGAMYGSVILYSVLGYGIMQPFTKQSTAWGTGIISCDFWYLLVILLILLLGSTMLLFLMKWYKNRKREDVLPNEQIFAERYYSRN